MGITQAVGNLIRSGNSNGGAELVATLAAKSVFELVENHSETVMLICHPFLVTQTAS
jgi:hypothetical protein